MSNQKKKFFTNFIATVVILKVLYKGRHLFFRLISSIYKYKETNLVECLKEKLCRLESSK